MASRYSKVSRRVWVDEKFRSLSAPEPNAQSLWFRLLTGPELTCIPGVFSAWEAGMAQSLRWPLEAFREAFAEVSAKGMVAADWEAGLVFVPHAIQHNPPESPNVVRGWKTAWDEMPECGLKETARRHLKAFGEGLGEGFVKAFREVFAEGYGEGGSRAAVRAFGESGAGSGAGADSDARARVSGISDASTQQTTNGRPDGATHIRLDHLSGHAWCYAYGTFWSERYGRVSYGNGSDAKAEAQLGDLLARMPEAEALSLWERRRELFDLFLDDDEERVVRAGHPFAFFVARFSQYRPDVPRVDAAALASRRRLKVAAGMKPYDPNDEKP